MKVVALCGLPGSGKSTLAAALAERTAWRRMDRDALRIELGLGYTAADRRRLGEFMQQAMKNALEAGQSVILDGMTFSREMERREFRLLAEAFAAHWLLVWLDCAPELARQRIAADRSHPAADRTPELVDAVHARFEAPADALRIDASDTIEQMLDRLTGQQEEARHET